MAQAPAEPDWDRPLTAIGTLQFDGDGDFIPDGIGEEVLIGGRISAGTGVLRADKTEIYIQDGTGGLRLRLPPDAEPVLTGDSVLVSGTLAFADGMAEMVAPAVRAIEGESRSIEAIDLPLVEREGGGEGPDLESHEGQLVTVEGRGVEVGEVPGGLTVILVSGTSLVQLFSYTLRPGSVTFEDLSPGDYVRARGIAAQYDEAAPYNYGYVLYPLVEGDISRAGLSPDENRNSAVAIGALLLAALLWAWLLRRQVRRRTEALEASEVRYGHLFDAAADAVLVIDLESGGEIVEANRAAQRAFSITPYGNRPKGGTVRLADLAADEHEAARHLADADRSGAASTVLELAGSGDSQDPYEVATRRLRDGSGRTVVALARNVADRRDYEHGLLRAISAAEDARAKAEEADKLKSSILANMSHEVRTPLTAIIGFADILKMEVSDDLFEYADSVRDGGQRLLDTLNDILEFARLDAQHVTVAPEPIDVPEVVRNSVAVLAPLAQKKGLGLHLQSEVAELHASHSPKALSRIVTTLVGNAIKFTDSGEVRTSGHQVDGFFAIRVQDSGVGISEEFLRDLYEAFKQESHGHGRDFEGTGLGLAIAKQLVDLMGGEIRVWSEKGSGSVFEVALPLEGPPGAELDPYEAELAAYEALLETGDTSEDASTDPSAVSSVVTVGSAPAGAAAFADLTADEELSEEASPELVPAGGQQRGRHPGPPRRGRDCRRSRTRR